MSSHTAKNQGNKVNTEKKEGSKLYVTLSVEFEAYKNNMLLWGPQC